MNERMLSSGWGNIRCEERNGCKVFLIVTEGIMVCWRGLMVIVKRFVSLFIGYKRGGEIKGEAGGVSLVHFKNWRNDLILSVQMPLPRIHSSKSNFHSFPFSHLGGYKKKKKRIYLCESILLKRIITTCAVTDLHSLQISSD